MDMNAFQGNINPSIYSFLEVLIYIFINFFSGTDAVYLQQIRQEMGKERRGVDIQ